MLTASSATGQLVFLPLAAWLVEHFGWRYALAPSVIGLLVAGVLVTLFMCDRPSDIGLAPFGEAAPAPGQSITYASRRRCRLSGAPSRSWARSGRTEPSGFCSRPSSSAGSARMASSRPISSRSRRLWHAGGRRCIDVAAMMGVFDPSERSPRAGFPTDTTTVCRYSGIMACGDFRCSTCPIRPSPSTACRYSGPSMVSTGLRRSRPPCGSARRLLAKRGRASLLAGYSPRTNWARATAALGAGLSRSILLSYLPAFFAAGAMCLVASAIVWLIRSNPTNRGVAA